MQLNICVAMKKSFHCVLEQSLKKQNKKQQSDTDLWLTGLLFE